MRPLRQLLVLLTLALACLICQFAPQLVFSPLSPEATVMIEPAPTDCSGEACLEVCLHNLNRVLATSPFEPLANEIYVERKARLNLVVYPVEGDALLEPTVLWAPQEYHVYQEDSAAHQRIWDFYVTIIPAEQRSLIREFVIFTDGPHGNVGAWVQNVSDEKDEWRVGFDILDSDYPVFLADALVHETGHLITLNNTQIPYDELLTYTSKQDHPRCPQYISAEGCSLPDSYINLFYQRFWKENWEEWWELDKQAQEADTPDEYRRMMEPFYRNHQDEFVTRYAATNIDEDLAESWTTFVLSSRPEGDDAATQKILFFYDFPELVELRASIIAGLCSYMSRP